MNNVIYISIVLLCSQLLACQSTKIVQVDKRPIISDRQLLVSLLNRPIPEDQQLMLAFTRNYQEQTNLFPLVAPISIIGNRNESDPQHSLRQFSYLINRDKNAIRINGPI